MAIIENITNAASIHRNTILQGDCLTILPTLPAQSVDFILTDPPYITRYQSRDGRIVQNDDNDRWLKPAFEQMHRVLRNNAFAVSFYRWSQADKFLQAYRAAGFRVVGHLAFPKRYTSRSRFVRYQHECAHLLAKVQSTLPAGHYRRCNRLDLQRQQAASDTEVALCAASAHRNLLPQGRHGARSVQRLWLLVAGREKQCCGLKYLKS